MFSAWNKAALMVLIGIVAFCAAPAAAKSVQTRLLFMGISKDGRSNSMAENAIQVRIAGLDVSVIRAKDLPLCDHGECLSALTNEQADLALTGRILRNEHACLATLWLAVMRDSRNPIVQDVACRVDGRDTELLGSLADAAASLVDNYLRSREPDSRELAEITKSNYGYASEKNAIGRKKWQSGRKIAIASSIILGTLGIAGISYFASLDKQLAPVSAMPCHDESKQLCPQLYSYGTQIALFGALTAASTTSLLFLTIQGKGTFK